MPITIKLYPLSFTINFKHTSSNLNEIKLYFECAKRTKCAQIKVLDLAF